MGKVLKVVALVAAVAINAIPVVGQAVSAAVLGSTLAATTIVGTLTVGALFSATLAAGLMAVSSIRSGGAGTSSALSRLTVTFDPLATRKMVFGTRTALATDVLYSEPSGTEQEYIDYIICCAAHRGRIDEIWTDTTLLWSRSGGIASKYSGYAWVTAIDEGSAANAININGGGVWSAAECRLTGCCYFHLRIKRTGNSSKASSPFATGLSGRMTVIGAGMPCYDPRKDSTRGGSGSHRVDDQSTWEATDNTSSQQISALLGWRINGVVSVGAGVLISRLRPEDFASGSNIDDEDVELDEGGTQARYESAGVFDDSMDAVTVASILGQAQLAELSEAHGRLGLRHLINDLDGPVLELGPEDILGAVSYTGQNALHEAPNVVRGKFVDPSTASLFQMTPYVDVGTTSVDGNDRAHPLDLPVTQDPLRARRIAGRVLARAQLGGLLTADFGPRAWAARVGDPVRLMFPALGLDGEYFRVKSATYKVVVDQDGASRFCPLELERDSPTVYDRPPDAAPEPAITPVDYDPANNILLAVENAVSGGDMRTVAVVIGTSAAIEVMLEPSGGVTLTGQALVNATTSPTSNATATLKFWSSTDGVNWSEVGSATWTEPVPDPVFVENTGVVVTNPGAVATLYRFRATLAMTPSGASGAIDGSMSFFTVS